MSAEAIRVAIGLYRSESDIETALALLIVAVLIFPAVRAVFENRRSTLSIDTYAAK